MKRRRAMIGVGILTFFTGAPAAPPQSGPPRIPTFEGTIELEFGELTGEDPYLFSRIESIVEDANGRLIVADLQAHEVRVFDPDGRFVFLFGGAGEGPGDLTNPCCLAIGPDGLLWVRESSRYSVFALGPESARYERGLRVGHAGIGMVAPVTFDAAGRLVDIGPIRDAESTSLASLMARLHRSADGAVDTVVMADPERQPAGSTTVQRQFGDMSATVFVYQPYGPRWLHAHGPGGAWAEVLTSEYVVAYHHADGGESRIEGPSLQGPSLSTEEREYAQDWIDRDLQRLDLRNHPFDIPGRKPPLAAVYFDRSGRLWVEKARAQGDEMREADVYEGSTLVARYRWPRRVDPGTVPWITESVMLGTTRDELDVQRVARVRFHRVGEPVHAWFLWRPQLRDPGDEMVLEAAVNGRADALVTFNNRDFGDVPEGFGISIISPRQALRRLKE